MSKNIIIALDFATGDKTLQFLDLLDPNLCRVKIGKELFTASGPQLVRKIIDRGFDVFLDLKFHDIPNTVARASKVAADLGIWMFNIHASGGRTMMEAARESIDSLGNQRPLLIGVTVLTSFLKKDLEQTGIHSYPEDQVSKLAFLAPVSYTHLTLPTNREV